MPVVADPVVLGALGSAGGLVAFFAAFRKLRTLRRIENTPTSAVRSMPMGLVELHGAARSGEPHTAPFSEKPVAFYRARVEQYRRRGRSSRWVTIHDEISSEAFWLEDETGRVLVLPEGAELNLPSDYHRRFNGSRLPAHLESYLDGVGIAPRSFGFGKSLRFTEWHIGAGQPFYLHGLAQEHPGLRGLKRERTNEILRAVRSDPERMAALDSNGDGRVDPEEWDRAREEACARAGSEEIEDRIVVARGGPGDLFLISDRSERELVRRLRWETALYLFFGGAAFVAGTATLIHRAGWIG